MSRSGNSQNRLDRRAFIGTGVAAALAATKRTASAQSEGGSIGNDSRGRPLPCNPRIFEAMPTRNPGRTGHYDPFILTEAINHYPFDTLLMAFNDADKHQYSLIDLLPPVALEKKLGIIGMKVATRGRMLSTWAPPPLEEQLKRMATKKPGTIIMRESLF